MFFSLSEIVELTVHFGYWFIFTVVVIEGPIATIIAGFLASLGYFKLFPLYVVIVFGDLVGDVLYYLAGKWGGRPFVEKWGRYLGFNSEIVENLEKDFNKNMARIFIIGKVAHGLGGVVLITAGVLKVPFRKFFWLNFWPTLPKSLILLWAGYYYGTAYVKLNKIFNIFGIVMLVLGIFFPVIYYSFGKKILDKIIAKVISR